MALKLSKESQPLTVSNLTNDIKQTLENSFAMISVKGEISNFKQHSSGHRYFTLKDDKAQIACTMWKHRYLNFVPADGMLVVINGSVTVYPLRGNYQIDCASMDPAGKGDLHIAFEALKKKLSEKGYFAVERKRPIPVLPMKIGVATSPTGAAIKDIISTIARRFPAAEVYFRPTLVQGDGAAKDIADAVKQLNDSPADIIIIGRGGGSLEDLWCFNEEIVADAIFNSAKPIITAVGHETDFTISDFTADHRAATPTAAAEMATPYLKEELLRGLERHSELLAKALKARLDKMKEIIAAIRGDRTSRRIREKINIYNQYLDDLESRMKQQLKFRIKSDRQKLDGVDSLLKSLHPLNPLKRGFALLKAGDEFITNKNELKDFKRFEVIRKNDTARVKLEKILPRQLF
ncbi:MAG: exodeoxyribonuclease VII large subunit [Bacteroidota bacterium]